MLTNMWLQKEMLVVYGILFIAIAFGIAAIIDGCKRHKYVRKMPG